MSRSGISCHLPICRSSAERSAFPGDPVRWLVAGTVRVLPASMKCRVTGMLSRAVLLALTLALTGPHLTAAGRAAAASPAAQALNRPRAAAPDAPAVSPLDRPGAAVLDR